MWRCFGTVIVRARVPLAAREPIIDSKYEDIIMSRRIDQFCEDLHLKLTNIDTGLGGLKAKIDGKAQSAEQEARSHLEKVQKRIEQNRTKVSSAQAEVKNWVEEQKTATRDKIAD